MHLDIGDKITADSIHENNITGNITAILENTIIVVCGLNNHVINKKELKKQGYKFTKVVKKTKSIAISSNRNFKK